jgi:hypothetical protein
LFCWITKAQNGDDAMNNSNHCVGNFSSLTSPSSHWVASIAAATESVIVKVDVVGADKIWQRLVSGDLHKTFISHDLDSTVWWTKDS